MLSLSAVPWFCRWQQPVRSLKPTGVDRVLSKNSNCLNRHSRLLLDFTRMLSVFDKYKVSFVAVTQQSNSSTSLARLTLNILLSFAQFERELIGERARGKMSAARRKGNG